MGDLSPHFASWEFECHGDDGCKRLGPSLGLLVALERLRESNGGHPLTIVSGFRCVRHNDAVGGAFASRHLEGDAADLEPGVLTVEGARALGFGGIGISGVWVTHVDMRPGGTVQWEY